jgi:hypothetical protein
MINMGVKLVPWLLEKKEFESGWEQGTEQKAWI